MENEDIKIDYAQRYKNHTPGKWVAMDWVRVADGGDCPSIIKAEGAPYGIEIAAIHFDIKHGVGSKEATANAYLISQAPELKSKNEQLQSENLCLKEAIQNTRVALMDAFGLFGGGHKLNVIFDILNKAMGEDKP